MARRPKKDETHYFRVTFEDDSSEKWGYHPLDLRGNHMARQFVREREEREAKLEKREARKITGVNRISGYPRNPACADGAWAGPVRKKAPRGAGF